MIMKWDASVNERIFQYCPQCGARKFVPKGVKNFHCLECRFEYYFNPCGAVVGMVFDSDGRILMTRRAHDPAAGTLDLPGGFIDFDETAEAALRRELHEELNLQIGDLHYDFSMPNLYEFCGVLYHTIDFFFRCEAVNLADLEAREEISEFLFLPIDKIDLTKVGFKSIKRGLTLLKQRVESSKLVL